MVHTFLVTSTLTKSTMTTVPTSTYIHTLASSSSSTFTIYSLPSTSISSIQSSILTSSVQTGTPTPTHKPTSFSTVSPKPTAEKPIKIPYTSTISMTSSTQMTSSTTIQSTTFSTSDFLSKTSITVLSKSLPS